MVMASVLLWRLFTPAHRVPANHVAGDGHKPAVGQPLAESPLHRGDKPFLALPSFAFVAPEEDLRIVRVQMPVSSLRLLGARVNDELITHDVVADLLVGADGTPYAFRLVS